MANQAGCSPSTFYRYFSTKQDAALAVYDRWVADKVAHHTLGHGSDLANIRALLRSLADSLKDDPATTHLAIIAVFALGKTGHERHLRTLLEIENAVRDAVSDRAIPNIALEATVGALWEVLYSHTLNQSHTPDLAAKLAFLLLTPFMGSERASLLARDT
jgi:AcrR family transcriptional regulator